MFNDHQQIPIDNKSISDNHFMFNLFVVSQLYAQNYKGAGGDPANLISACSKFLSFHLVALIHIKISLENGTYMVEVGSV